MSDETQNHGDDSTERIELASPPAPPTAHAAPTDLVQPSATGEGEGHQEDGAGTAAPVPSSSTDSEEDADAEGDTHADALPSSEPTVRERIRTLEDRRHRSSAGFGVSGKFDGAREDRADQEGEE
jgi:hypothetical protein